MRLEHVVRIMPDEYQGEYTAVPAFEPQVFSTKYKTMADDLTFKAIQVYEVSNESGGTTVTIGGEFYG